MTTDCERWDDRKLLLAEGERPRDAALSRHLEACAACRADVDEMREVRDLYRETATEEMPGVLRRRVLALAPAPQRPSLWVRLMPAAVAALLLATLILPFLRPAPASTRTPVDAWEPPPVDDERERIETIEAKEDDAAPTRRFRVDTELQELRRLIPPLPKDLDW